MPTLTDDGQRIVADIARRHGVSNDAASHLLSAIEAGGGRQAQFNHPELGGMGQWSQGGMTMIGDMFNNGLKARVAALCSELADALQGAPLLAQDEPQPLWNPAGDTKSAKLFMLKAFGHRWPSELGAPASTGSQNDLHYAIFPGSRRLAIEQRGRITVYDTEDHRIGGVSQQQGGEQSLRFTSQSGLVRLSDLRVVRGDWESAEPGPADNGAAAAPQQQAANGATVERPASPPRSTGPGLATDSDDAIFSRLERLAELRSRDIITAEEFAAKKAELLARL